MTAADQRKLKSDHRLNVSGGTPELAKQGASLAKDARVIFEKLGPTYIKLGQMMSVRPDVLPKEALVELKYLQDSGSIQIYLYLFTQK